MAMHFVGRLLPANGEEEVVRDAGFEPADPMRVKHVLYP